MINASFMATRIFGLTNEAAIFAVCVVALAVAGCGILAVLKIAEMRRSRELDARADARYKRWRLALMADGGELSPCLLPIHLTRNEYGYFCDKKAKLYELRAVRAGNIGGASFRVAKGVTIHSGGFRSESHDEWRETSRGALYVTNKRIIFDGEKKNRIVKLSEVLSVDRGYRMAMVNSSAVQKPIAFGSINGQIFADVVDMLCDVGRNQTREDAI